MQLAQPFTEDRIGRYVGTNASIQPLRPRTTIICVHHAAAVYPPGTACDKIFQAHSTRPDFGTYRRIGYHEVIQINPGDVLRAYLVNPPEMQGAGVWGRNDVCYHICAATHFRNAIPDPVWIEAIAQRVAAALRRYPGAVIKGHKEVAKGGHGTSCPGDAWDAWKPTVKARVDHLLRPEGAGVYRVRGLPVYQTPDLQIVAGYLAPGEQVTIGKTYPNGAGWVATGAGFIDMDGTEPAT